MKSHAITAAAVRLLNEQLDAMPLGRYASKTQFLKTAAKVAGTSAENMRKIMVGETPSLRLDYLYALAQSLDTEPLELLRQAEALASRMGDSLSVVSARGGDSATQESEQADKLTKMVEGLGGVVQGKSNAQTDVDPTSEGGGPLHPGRLRRI